MLKGYLSRFGGLAGRCLLLSALCYLLFDCYDLYLSPWRGTGALTFVWGIASLVQVLGCGLLGWRAASKAPATEPGTPAKRAVPGLLRAVLAVLLAVYFLVPQYRWNLSTRVMLWGHNGSLTGTDLVNTTPLCQFLVLRVIDVPAVTGFLLCWLAYRLAMRKRAVPVS